MVNHVQRGTTHGPSISWKKNAPDLAGPQRGHDSPQPRGKDSREIQELLRHKSIRTTVRYTHVGCEQTRQTAEALSRALE
jgi:hypothetical protein